MAYLNSSQSQPRDDEVQRTDKKPALIDINLEQVLSSENLQQAWRRVRKNKGAPGIDGMSIEAFPDFIKKAWKEFILPSLQDGSYQPETGCI